MKEKEKLELYKPWYAFPFFLIEYNNMRESNESKFKGYEWDRENDYYLEGSISNIHGALKLGENKIICSIPNISCENALYIIINGFMYKQQDFREYIDIREKNSKNWVGHVLVFYIVYGGMCEPLANLTEYTFNQVSNTKKQIRNQIDVSTVESDE